MPPLRWTDADEIGYQLSEQFKLTDPLSVSFPHLRDMVLGLKGFSDDPAKSSEGLLEAIQMAWLDHAKEE
jgi:FeS assembly protein IscX